MEEPAEFTEEQQPIEEKSSKAKKEKPNHHHRRSRHYRYEDRFDEWRKKTYNRYMRR